MSCPVFPSVFVNSLSIWPAVLKITSWMSFHIRDVTLPDQEGLPVRDPKDLSPSVVIISSLSSLSSAEALYLSSLSPRAIWSNSIDVLLDPSVVRESLTVRDPEF